MCHKIKIPRKLIRKYHFISDKSSVEPEPCKLCFRDQRKYFCDFTKSLSKNATRWENVSFSWNKFEYEKRLRKIRWFLKFNSKVCKIQVCGNFNSYKMLLSKKDKKCRLRIKNEMWNFLSNHMKKIKSIYKICNMLNSKWNQEPSTKGLFLLIFQFSQLS